MTASRQQINRAALGLGLLLVVGGGAVLPWSRATFHMWPWSAYPNPLHYCGRDYTPAGTESLTQIRATQGEPHKTGELPGILNSGEIWTVSVDPAEACGGVVFIRLSGDQFEAMSLEGGP